jgi:alpha-ketoglutarate-dependent taurine dioxygenase
MSIRFSSVDGQKQVNGLDFPLVVTPADETAAQQPEAANAWVHANRAQLHDLLIRHGALLLRGFAVPDQQAFEDMLNATDYQNMPYIGGAAPRSQVTSSRIVTANESPASESIPFHHEMAQVPTPPGYIFFYCDVASEEGGATSILHSGEIFSKIEQFAPEFAQKIEQQGVRSVRVMPAVTDTDSAIGRSWKETFNVSTVAQAEEQMSEAGMNWEWLADGSVRTQTAVLDAVRFDEETGQKVFFNSIVAVYTGWNDARNDGRTAVVTADGEPMDAAVIDEVVRQMDESCVNFKWQHGDVLCLNNHTVLHARQPFRGERRILASISFK